MKIRKYMDTVLFGVLLVLFLLTITCAADVELQEAYLNGSSYIRFNQPLPLWNHSAISFRTCSGGELFTQHYQQSTLHFIVGRDVVTLALTLPDGRRDFIMKNRLLDNEWHTVQFVYRLGNLSMQIDDKVELVANATFNKDFLQNDDLRNEAAILILGKMFSGCVLSGPGFEFSNTSIMRMFNVQFGLCPLSTDKCHDNQNVLSTRFNSNLVNYCETEPCMQHGRCTSRIDGYECHCPDRYSGKNCEVDKGDPCLVTPCQHGGTCNEDHRGDVFCQCTSGYTGVRCETELVVHPLCAVNPCMNNGTCNVRDGENVYECICAVGFMGLNCELDVDDCATLPCLHNSTCNDLVNSYTCDCSGSGYTGRVCDVNINECDVLAPCMNGARCFDTYGSYICECTAGYGGRNCEHILNECLSTPCLHGGACIDLAGSFSCECPQGRSGNLCERGPPCSNVLQCHGDSYCQAGECVCLPGTMGFSGQCVSNSGGCPTKPCQNGGSCMNYPDNPVCACNDNFRGDLCELPMPQPISEFDLPKSGCPCLNGGICEGSLNNTCVCAVGYAGPLCEYKAEEQCSPECVEPQICIRGSCSCPEGVNCPTEPCQSTPCFNGATCLVDGTNYSCQCRTGWKGDHCETDINECETPDICNHGICQNRNGSFQCYCEPGYTGTRCDMDFDECLSMPCKHNASCVNEVNDFTCHCAPGYTGKQCEVDINECESNPCSMGSTCTDLLATYECSCMPGMTGRNCEVDIDECESMPCQHGGLCGDRIANFSCNCTGTGYSGPLCEVNINECLSNPCMNGGKCEDKINDYQCECFVGYRGKNCEDDINECESNPCQFGGTCLQRSNQSLYGSYETAMPAIFTLPFSHQNASGYECICNMGTTGRNCEVNINECDSNPCSTRGTCVDKVGGYVCDCEPGFEGTHCQIDIDECERYKPCQHGHCLDGRATYHCQCDPLWGGINCSVKLTGCDSDPCLHNGICIPYVVNETEHKFNCSCTNGFQGATCDKITTMSHSGSSYAMINTTREEGYDIQLRFKTTLPNGLLAIGRGTTFYFLELSNGRLNLRSSLLNKWEGVFIGSALNDSLWHKVFVAINSSHLVLSANEEQTIYPINLNEGLPSITSFPITYLGGAVSNLRQLAHGPSSFVGCTEDVVINGEWVLPDETGASTLLVGISEGCPREPQCNPNPCHSGGHCTDLWRNFSCTCERPHLGQTCQYNITAATFGHENTTNSLVVVNVSDAARRAVRSVVDISMFIRTRQHSGQLFYLGSARQDSPPTPEESYVAAQLEGGELLVRIQFNNTPEAYTVGGNKLDNGYNHLIEVVRNATLVQVKLNGSEYFRKPISSTGQLDAQVLYLGGKPRSHNEPPRPARQAAPEVKQLVTDFKGIIQDVQISNGNNTMVVEFFPLDVPGLLIPPQFGVVSFDPAAVLRGVVSDDLCRKTPCQHNATCRNTWNDFECTCVTGYKGKACDNIEFCQLQGCPDGSVCQNFDAGYECVSNATFNGRDAPLIFRPGPPGSAVFAPVIIEIQYKSKTGGTLLHIRNGEIYFEIAVFKDQVSIQFRLTPEEAGISHRYHKELPDFEWTRITMSITDGTLIAGYGDGPIEPENALLSTSINQTAYDNLFNESMTVYLGGIKTDDVIIDGLPYNTEKSFHNGLLLANNFYDNKTFYEHDGNGILKNGARGVLNGAMFKGCLGEVRLGSMLLAFYPREEIYTDNSTNAMSLPYYDLSSNKPTIGCELCFEQDCMNGGHCMQPTNLYSCDCRAGYEGDDCSQDIDECLSSQCQNNSTCIDGIATYTCDCQTGYEGQFCESDIDECASNPCQNFGTCHDLLGGFECHCTEDYAGPQCEAFRLVTCANEPCRNGSTCTDGRNDKTGNNFTCECKHGLLGPLCDLPFCSIQPCKNGGHCLVKENEPPLCVCSDGFEGEYCELNIDECVGQPCQNGGICIDGISTFTCNCNNTGFTGPTCEIDVDECVTRRITCGGRGMCINTRGSFLCRCASDVCGTDCNLPDPCSIFEGPLTGKNGSVAQLRNGPCENGGTCVEKCRDTVDYECTCADGFEGKNCTEVAPSSDTTVMDIVKIVVPIVVGLLILGGALLTALLVMARNKRATRGTYSPSAQEYCNPRLEMDNVLKPPPEERLI